MLIRRLERVDFFKPKDGRYARMSLSTDAREPRRVGSAAAEDAPFTDVIAIECGGKVIHFLAEIVGAPGGDEYMSTKDAAARLGVKDRTVRRWAEAGKLDTVRTAGGEKRPGSWRVSRAAVSALLAEPDDLNPGPAPPPAPPRRKRVPPQIPGQTGFGPD